MELQERLNSAIPGENVLLSPGVIVGNFIVPKGVNILGGFIGHGNRVKPGEPSPIIVSPNSNPALILEGDNNISRIEITSDVYSNDIIRIGSLSESDPSKQPSNILFDQVYLHGHPTLGSKRGAMICGSDITFQNCHVSDFKSKDQDAMCFAICNSPEPGNIKFINNFLSASGYEIILGGTNFKLPDMLPSDVEVRGNYFFKPLEWDVEGWSVKNHFEIKNGRRVKVIGNIFENNWADAQTGFSILFTVKPGGIRTDGSLFSEISNVLFKNNLVLNSTSGINISAGSGVLKNLFIVNNKFEKVTDRLFQVLGNINFFNLLNNTALDTEDFAMILSNNSVCTPATITGNKLKLGDGGIKASGTKEGKTSIEKYFLNGTFVDNILEGILGRDYPAGNYETNSGGTITYGVDEVKLAEILKNVRSGLVETPEQPKPAPVETVYEISVKNFGMLQKIMRHLGIEDGG